MKSLSSRNKQIKWFHEVSGYPFSKCRQKLREEHGNLSRASEEYFLEKMKCFEEEKPDEEILMGSVKYVKMSGRKMTPELRILEDVERDVIRELNRLCVTGKWFKSTDIYFWSDHEIISIDIIDSDLNRWDISAGLDNPEDSIDSENRQLLIDLFIENTLQWYVETDFFEWER